MTGCKFDNDRHVNPPRPSPPFLFLAPARQVQAGTWLVTGLPMRGPPRVRSLDQGKGS